MNKVDLKIRAKRYKVVYDRQAHFKPVPNYLTVPYKDHFIVETWGVDPATICKAEPLKERMDGLVEKLGLHPVLNFTHQFVPHGVTGFTIVEESHLAIHTWPELAYAHLDILTCSKTTDFSKLDKIVEDLFNPQYYEIAELVY